MIVSTVEGSDSTYEGLKQLADPLLDRRAVSNLGHRHEIIDQPDHLSDHPKCVSCRSGEPPELLRRLLSHTRVSRLHGLQRLPRQAREPGKHSLGYSNRALRQGAGQLHRVGQRTDGAGVGVRSSPDLLSLLLRECRDRCRDRGKRYLDLDAGETGSHDAALLEGAGEGQAGEERARAMGRNHVGTSREQIGRASCRERV